MSRAAALALALAGGALAVQPAPAAAQSPFTGSFELRAGPYRPDIDAVFTGRGPYQKVFGSGSPYAFRLHAAKALPWRRLGTFEVGLGAGYWQVRGHAVDAAGDPTADRTALYVIPTQLTLTWRLDLLWDQLSIPLVPYGRASLERYNWWTTGPTGKTSEYGATNGFAYGGGVGLVLDFLDPMLARELDADSGVNHTLLVFDVSRTKVDDFGATRSLVFAKDATLYSAGLLFVF